MTRGGASKQRPNCVDGLSAAANHAADIALSKLNFKNGCSAARNFREHHVVGIFDQLPDDELEKFSHNERLTTNAHESTRIYAGSKNQRSTPFSAKAAKATEAGRTFLRPRPATERRGTQRLFRLPTSGPRRFRRCRFRDGWLRRRRRCPRGRRPRRRSRRAGDLFFIFLN
jgi:hypothetical protein